MREKEREREREREREKKARRKRTYKAPIWQAFRRAAWTERTIFSRVYGPTSVITVILGWI